MRRLDVYLHGAVAGKLEQDDTGQLRFSYTAEWLGRGNAQPLSRSLPLQSEPFLHPQARPFFAGVLPDEEPRRRVAAVLGISAENDFAMLERIGGECAGAVCLLPEDQVPPGSAVEDLRELEPRELVEVLSELPRRPLMAGEQGIRLSLAGAQNKLPVVLRGDTICLPLANTPSTHILKPEPERFPGLAANELLCMRLARDCGLDVPVVEYRMAAMTPYLLVERYDRHLINGLLTRTHQEDLCQALGLPPELKYEQEGGPSLSDCIGLLRDWSTQPVVDIQLLVDTVAFNAIIGNADAHAKNFSMLYGESTRTLSPMYDLVSTLVWPELSTNSAMRIGHCKSLLQLDGACWEEMAVECRLGRPMLRERIARVCTRVLESIQRVQERILDERAPVPGRMLEIIPARAEKTRAAIDGG